MKREMDQSPSPSSIRLHRRRAAHVLFVAAFVMPINACAQDDPTTESSGAAISAPLNLSPATTSNSDGTVEEQLRGVFDDLASTSPGCSAALSQDGVVRWAEGFGLADVDAGRAITPSTRFDIGSVSKQFTATAILLLEAGGVLDRHTSVSEVLDGMPPWADEVEIDDLIHHTSGIPDYIDVLLGDGHSMSDRTTQADAVEAVRAVSELEFEPGSVWSYSNSNYVLLAEIAEAISGETLPTFLAERVFGPLELDMVMDPVGDVAGKAVSYRAFGDRWEAQTSGWEQIGDGAIQASPSDLVRWASQYWDPTLGGPSVLAARSEGAVDRGDGLLYGAGIVRDGEQLRHLGDWLEFGSALVILPDQHAAAAVTCNRKGPDPFEFAQSMLDIWVDQ